MNIGIRTPAKLLRRLRTGRQLKTTNMGITHKKQLLVQTTVVVTVYHELKLEPRVLILRSHNCLPNAQFIQRILMRFRTEASVPTLVT